MTIEPGLSNHYHYHPSLDMHLDVWGGILEGLTWETIEKGTAIWDPLKGIWSTTPDIVRINFKTLVTVIDQQMGGRIALMPTVLYFPHLKRFIDTLGIGSAVPQYYPNTASLNTRYDWTSRNEKVLFSLVYSDNNSGSSAQMRQDKIELAEDFIWPAPQDYIWGGTYPNTSATWSRRADWMPDSVNIDPHTGDTTWILDPHTGDTLRFTWRGETWDRQPRRGMVLYQSHENSDTVLRTTRQYLYAKTRPGGYMATGRDVLLPIDSSVTTGFSFRLHDVWMAGDSIGRGLGMVGRDTSQRKTDSLAQVTTLLRTLSFTASDSVQIGFQVAGAFFGDSAGAGSAQVECHVELVDSASGSVVAVLDSFAVSNTTAPYHVWREPVVDLLSGTYYVRLRLTPSSLPAADITAWSSRYPVHETSGWVENPPLGKLRRVGATTGVGARVIAQPNPTTGMTEIRFSIPQRDYVSVAIYDGTGREVHRLMERTMMEAGRYAIEFDGSHLQAGCI